MIDPSLYRIWTLLIGCLFLLIGRDPAIADDSVDKEKPLFSNNYTIFTRIEAPFTTIMRDRSKTEYLDGKFTYLDEGEREQTLDVKIRTRGEFRNRKDICDFAPLRLNFRKKQVADTEFAGQDKLKLVTHCENRGNRYEQFLLTEYLTYKMLNLFTEQSFRARLMRITYVDTDKKNRERTRYAFLIEHEKDLGKRIGRDRASVSSVEAADLEPDQAALVAMFQYLIGNTDFSMVRGERDEDCCHNAVLFESNAGNFLPIPYDFDLSGIVDAPYAAPNPKYPIRSVKDRLYLGHCDHNAEAKDVLERFQSRQIALLALPDEVDGLNRNHHRLVRKYLDKFFDSVEKPGKADQKVFRSCI